MYKTLGSYVNCDEWSNGLNNTYIENNNNKYGCKIVFPKFCLYKIGKYWLDLSNLKKERCGHKETKTIILDKTHSKFISKNTTRFGYPITNKDPEYFIDFPQEYWIGFGKYFQKSIDNLIDMDNKTLLTSLRFCKQIYLFFILLY